LKFSILSSFLEFVFAMIQRPYLVDIKASIHLNAFVTKANKVPIYIESYHWNLCAILGLALFLLLGPATGRAGTFAFYGRDVALVASEQNTYFTASTFPAAYDNLFFNSSKPRPSSTDLLQILVGGSLASFTASGPQIRTSQTYSNLADASGNSTGGSHVILSNDVYGNASTFNTLNISLANAGAPFGYDISGINLYIFNVFAGIADNRNEFLFTLSYSTVAAPSTFIPLIGAYQRWETADSKAGSLLEFGFSSGVTGVHTIRLIDQLGTDGTRFRNDGQSTSFQEMDVFGMATIPEPSTYVLLGLGLGALAWLRRKNKKT